MDAVVSAIEQQMADIAPGYDEWVRLGYALADKFAERGRDYFQRLSALHPECTQEAADDQYSRCLNSTGSGVTISTLFHMAKEAGVSIPNADGQMAKWTNGNSAKKVGTEDVQIAKCPNVQEDNTDIHDNWTLEEDELPVFPEEVYAHLPTILDNVVKNAISPSDREVLLIGAITVLSSTLRNVCGVYDERTIFPNLYLFVVADAGIGKGALTLCRELIAPINSELHEHARKRAENCEKGKEKDLPMLTLVIPANSSASALIKTLSDNNGVGLMFETEGDTLSQTLKSDYGNFSDVLRKAFHHETVSLCRRKDREFLELDCPKLSVALAGTPGQVRNLIPDSENGLFSRFIFYNLKFEQSIRNVFAITDPKHSKTEVFFTMGKHYKNLVGKIHREASSYEITIPPLLQGYFMDHYNRLNNEGCGAIGNKVQAVVRRNGLIAFRIMMVLTIIRHLTDDVYTPVKEGESLNIECSDEDFHTALTIAETLLYHSVYILRQLDKAVQPSSLGKVDRKEKLYDMLPHGFSKQEYLSVVKELGYSESTCNKWLSHFLSVNRLRHCGHSLYEKVSGVSLPNDADVQ